MQLTVEQAVAEYGRLFRDRGWGRYRIADFLNERYRDEEYSTYFGRQVVDRIAQMDSEGSQEPDEGTNTPRDTEAPPAASHAATGSVIDRERQRLGLDDTWEPQKVWGDGQVSFKKTMSETEVNEIMGEFLQATREYAPDYAQLQREKTQVDNPFGDYMAIMGLKDVHFGKLAHRDEAGEDYDLKIAMRRWKSAALQLLAKVAHVQASRVIIPIGSDALHVNGGDNATVRGTQQDVDGRWWKAFDEACSAYRWLIEHTLALPSVNQINAVTIPGNHGGEFELALGRWVQAWFHQVENITHDVRPIDRKYIMHGQTLIGFTHGENVKLNQLPQIMAVDVPEMWGASTYREFHTDHRHHRSRQLSAPGDYEEFPGVLVTINPALCGPGKWSFENGYVGSIPGAQVSIYDDYGQEWIGWAKVKKDA